MCHSNIIKGLPRNTELYVALLIVITILRAKDGYRLPQLTLASRVPHTLENSKDMHLKLSHCISINPCVSALPCSAL